MESRVVIVVEIAVRVGARADFLPRAGGGVEPGVDVDGVRQNGFFLLGAAEIGERLVRLDADRQEAASLTGDDLLVGQHRDGLHRVILPVPAVEGAGLMTGVARSQYCEAYSSHHAAACGVAGHRAPRPRAFCRRGRCGKSALGRRLSARRGR